MAVITLWHNPRCSKSRQALALLENRGASVTTRRYLDDAPSLAELRAALALLGLKPADILRTGEAMFKTLGLSKTMPDDTLLAAMAENPILIERPIALTATAAAIGRPSENVLYLL